jgi:cytochrome P450
MVLRDHRRFSSNRRKAATYFPDPLGDELISLLSLDPPDHTRLRSLVNKAFTPRRIESLRPRIEQTVDDLLGAVNDASPFDIIQTLAYPLPVIVIAAMLGIPPEDRDRFKVWSDDLARTLEPTMSAREGQRAVQSVRELKSYFSTIIDERRRQPRSDLISDLVAVEIEGDKLSHDELLALLILLLVAGNETTTNLIGNGLLALLRHPQQFQRLRENPALIDSAVEELLRYDSPVQTDSRIALTDIVIRGRQIKKGDVLLLLIGAANRDPDMFANPDQLDIARSENSYISFGRGIHHCLGAPLALLEGQIAFRKLIEHFADIRIAATPRFRDHVVLRGLRSLWVEVARVKTPASHT